MKQISRHYHSFLSFITSNCFLNNVTNRITNQQIKLLNWPVRCSITVNVFSPMNNEMVNNSDSMYWILVGCDCPPFAGKPSKMTQLLWMFRLSVPFRIKFPLLRNLHIETEKNNQIPATQPNMIVMKFNFFLLKTPKDSCSHHL